MAVDVRRASERFHTKIDWLESWHSFSFGGFHDPANTHHGLLLVNNDDVIRAGGGFGEHPHADMEIVTWVLDGALEHRDSLGTDGVITPGLAQRMSAGRGIRHSEVNASATDDVHLVQMWVLPDTKGIEPGYEQHDLGEVAGNGLVPVASGRGHDGAVSIHQRDAVLWVARLRAGEQVTLPDTPHAHVFVALGAASLGGTSTSIEASIEDLATGDAARLAGAGALDLTAGADGCEVLVWETG